MTTDLVEDWLPGADDRIIEVCPPDGSTFEFLRRQGRSRYLALVADHDEAARVATAGVAADRVAVMESSDDVRRNSADVLIIHGELARLLWYRQLGLARFILIPVGSPAEREALLVSRLHRRRSFQIDLAGRRYHVLAAATVHGSGARHYLSPVVGLDALPARLDQDGIDYVVLRWFERLPERDEGEDLDVLVRDEHLETLVAALDEEPGTIPVDVYSETGRPDSDFRAMAYYPPKLSAGLLDRAVRLPSGYRAPAPADHFHSLAYHALYHKGAACGLPTATMSAAVDGQPEHDYLGFLSELAEANQFDGPMTMERLDEALAHAGWRPPRDMLAKLSHDNDWVAGRFFSTDQPRVEPPLLTVFVMRAKASDAPSLALAETVLRRHGFEILGVHPLDPEAVARCTAEIRGGNWGPGPFPLSGGAPCAVVVAMDIHPQAPTSEQHRQHPDLANAHTLDAKLDFRSRLMADRAADQQFNPMHSSDSDEDAWHYLELAVPEIVDDVRTTVKAGRENAGWLGHAPQAGGPRSMARATAQRAKRSTRSALGTVRRRALGRAGTAVRFVIARRMPPIGSMRP